MKKLLLILLLIPAIGYSAGPSVVANANRTLWSGKTDTEEGFDKASRASLLVYILGLHEVHSMSTQDIMTDTKIKSINSESVSKWLDNEVELSFKNYELASKNCHGRDWTCININDLKSNTIPDSAWLDNVKQFTHNYILEQVRLAALFPKVSSEIDLFNANEFNGNNLSDRKFLLTFDDGPTGANTEKTLNMLSETKKTAVFFVLGENFEKRKSNNIVDLYKNQCVASHGWEHQSHAKWTEWQSSILKTQNLLQSTFKKQNSLFRPPYGQRKADSGSFFKENKIKVVLWNIDSQDWNNKVSADDVVNRVEMLMLIKRHGIILFHDIHPKANVALPVIFNDTGNAVKWNDCKTMSN